MLLVLPQLFAAEAESGVIVGRVSNKGTGEFLVGALIRLDGRDLDRSWVGFRELAAGATLEFDLAAQAPPGPGPADAPPPSFPPSRPDDACAPG